MKITNNSYLLFDVGGTEIKAGALSEDGDVIGEIKRYESKSEESAESILDNFSDILLEWMQRLRGCYRIAGIGMAFPGPFDYERGISLMKSLHKYDSIYGIPLEKEFRRKISVEKDVPFVFVHDAEAFALGSAVFGKGKGVDRIFCVTLGTGLGSAFVCSKKIIKSSFGVPENGWIYNTPFKEARLDEYLSARGIESLTEVIFQKKLTPKQVSDLYRDPQSSEKEKQCAEKVYRSFGKDVVEGLKPFLSCFLPELVILGGQIAKSYSLFGKELEEFCTQNKILVDYEEDTSLRTMQGVLAVIKEREKIC